MAYRSKSGIQFTPASGSNLQAFLFGGAIGALQGGDKFIERERVMELEDIKQKGQDRRAEVYANAQIEAAKAGRLPGPPTVSQINAAFGSVSSDVQRMLQQSTNPIINKMMSTIEDELSLGDLSVLISREIRNLKNKGDALSPEDQIVLQQLEQLAGLIGTALSEKSSIGMSTDSLLDWQNKFRNNMNEIFAVPGVDKTNTAAGTATPGPETTEEVITPPPPTPPPGLPGSPREVPGMVDEFSAGPGANGITQPPNPFDKFRNPPQ
jgi:hypothetical protein